MRSMFEVSRGTVPAIGLLWAFLILLTAAGCTNSVNPNGDPNGSSSDDPNDSLPYSVEEDPEFSQYRVSATPLNDDRSEWEFEVTSDLDDLDGLTFQWSLNDENALPGTNKQRFSFSRPGVHEISLTALNADRRVLFTRRVQIEVPEFNAAPVADAGDDQTVNENELVYLYGEESHDPDDDEVVFAWMQTAGPAVSLLDDDRATASFVAPMVGEETELEFVLTVGDGDLEGEDAVRVLVLDAIDGDDDLGAAGVGPGSGSGGTGGVSGGGGSTGTTPNPCTLDGDADGVNDCLDQCPEDPLKASAGECGCGIEDADANENGIPDCFESDAAVAGITLIVYAGPDQVVPWGTPVTMFGAHSGGTYPYVYQWTPAAGLNNPSLLRPIATPNATTVYTLTVTDALNRTGSDSVQLTVTGVLAAHAGPDVSIVPGGSTGLSGSATGGSTPYTYRWTPTTGLNNPNIAAPTASPSSTTTYTLTVTDSLARTATDSMVVTVQAALAANAGPDRTIPSGGSATLSGSASGGTSPYTYRWTPTTGLSNPNIAAPTASPSSTTTYTLTVTDAAARTATDTVQVTVETPLTANAGPDRTIQAGASATLTGSATGGTTPYTYRWAPATGLSNPNVAQPTASPSVTTTYTLTVTDALARTSWDSATVTVQAAPAAVLSASPTSLSFGNTTTSLSFSVWNSGSGTLDYTVSDNASWLTTSPNSGSSTGEQDTINVTVNRTGLANGSYQGDINVTPSTGTAVTVYVFMTVGATSGSAMTTASRTTGVAPLSVFFDAVGPASGVVQPPVVNGRADHASFHYHWNFGDNPNALWSTNNRSKNEAFGFVSAHVYENPGTFTVTLTVTRADGGTQTFQQQITVQNPEVVYANTSNSTAERTFYVAAEGADTNNGSYNQPFRTWAHARTRLFASNGPRRVLLKRGQSFTHSSGGSISNRSGPYTIGAYGTGANPTVTSTDTGGPLVSLAATATDVRVMDLSLVGPGGGQGIRPGTSMLVLRTRITNFDTGVSTSDLFGNKAYNSFVDCVIENNIGYGFYYNFGEHVAIMGNLISKPNTGPHDHVLRTYTTRSLISNNLIRGGTQRGHQLKFMGFFPTGHPERALGTPTETVEYCVIADNVFEGSGDMSWLVVIGAVDDTKDQRNQNIVFERNVMRADDHTRMFLHGGSRYITVRNNVFDATGGMEDVTAVRITESGIAPPPVGYHVYNNTMYNGNSATQLRCLQIDDMASNTSVYNNLGSGSLVTPTQFIHGGGTGLQAGQNVIVPLTAFTNPAGGDFSLRQTSTAIDAGTALQSVRLDYMGLPRPFDGNNTGGAQWDLGAYEYRSGGGNPTNAAPMVDAGQAQQITLPTAQVSLDATVTDDGLPNPPAAVSVTWSRLNGPGNVTFGNANTVDTTANFTVSGVYTLRLSAGDGALTTTDDVTITVNPAAVAGAERMGMNTSKVYGWGTHIPFVDAFKLSRPWISANADGTSSDTGVVIPTDAEGYPLQIPYDNGVDPPQIVRTIMLDVQSGTYPAGTYTLIFAGNGTIRLYGNATGIFDQAGGENSYSFTVSAPSGAGIQLRIVRSEAADRVRNVRVIMPGHLATYQTQPFYPPYLTKLNGFGVIRFMEWIRCNGNDRLVNWSDRVTTGHVTQAGPKGASFEHAVQLSNAVGADCWLTIPHLATDAFVTELARMVRQNLSAQRKVYVEYSNEVWNGMFEQTTYVRDQGLALGLGPDATLAGRRFTAKRSAEIFRIFETEFASERSRLVNVLAGQASNATVATQLMDAFYQSSINGVPINPNGAVVNALAIAPYFGNGLADSIVTNGEVSSITVTEILNRAESTYLPQAVSRMQANKVVAVQRNVPLIAYEGGQHIVATGNNVNNDTLTQKLVAANRDPRMYDLYRTYFDAWFDAGGEVFAHYSYCTTPGQYGSFGALEHLGQTAAEAPKYRALMDIVALPD